MTRMTILNALGSRWNLGASLGAVLLALGMTACSTQQLNTHATAKLPVEVQRLELVFERTEFKPSDPKRSDPMGPSRALMLQKVETGVETKMVAALKQAGIDTSYAAVGPLATDGTSVTSAASSSTTTHSLRVTPVQGQQTCNGMGGCSLTVRVRMTLTTAGGTDRLWVTELQESSMTPAIITQGRYDAFAQELAKAALVAVASAKH